MSPSLPLVLPGIDAPVVLRRFGGNWAVVQLLIKQFVSLHEGVEIKAAELFDKREYAQLRELAHKTKGAAANLSATAVCESAQKLENASKDEDVAGMEIALRRMAEALTILRNTARSIAS